MTAKLISLAGLLLLSSSAYADNAQPQTTAQPAVTTTAMQATVPPIPQLERLAWQRVGAPISLET